MRRAFVLVLLLVVPFAGCSEASGFEEEVRAVPVPEGGVLVSADHTSRGTPRANALYHYPASLVVEDLLNETQEVIEDARWAVVVREHDAERRLGAPDSPRGLLRAQRDGRLLDVEVGRWTADYGGCCVFTDDPARPIGLFLTLYDDPSNKPRR